MSDTEEEFLTVKDSEFSEAIRVMVMDEYGKAIASGTGVEKMKGVAEIMVTLLRGTASLIMANPAQDPADEPGRQDAMIKWADDCLRRMCNMVDASNRQSGRRVN